MKRILGRYEDAFYTILRIMAGLMFALHGSQKLLGYPASGNPAPPIMSLMGAAGVIELVGGLLIALGLFTGIAAFLASGEMAVAFFKAHVPQGGLNPLVNHGELAVLYCFLFLYIAARGSGPFGLDREMRRKPA